MPGNAIDIVLSGREATARLPAMLHPAARSAADASDPFFPPHYLTPVTTYDVSPAARSGADGTTVLQHEARADEVVVLELVDGSTFITSAGRLRATLELTQPDLVGQHGEVLLEALNARNASSRGLIGDMAGGLISKVFTLTVGNRDAIINDALSKLKNVAELGISWAGTKALMAAIESRLVDPGPGLYRWTGASGKPADLEPVDFADSAIAEPHRHPMLVFIHGTGSSTFGSFAELRTSDRNLWAALERKYSGGIFAFEHRTLSESPIDNALQLAQALPSGAHVSLVSHSSGGLVADLLCLGDFDQLINGFKHAFEGTGDTSKEEAQRVIGELGIAHAEHRQQLQRLADMLRARRLVVQRYVRTASPAQGTKLASGNFDLFLSGILTLIGQVPAFFGNPIYSAFKRVVVEIARNRTNPHLVPGIEAMLPDSPMARLLRDAPVRDGIEMAVIAGDIEGGNLLKRLGVLLTDFLLFENVDNDLVVDTGAMLAGIAPKAHARVLFDRGADVSHFRYFSNFDTRAALCDWLVTDNPLHVTTFRELPGQPDGAVAQQGALARETMRASPDIDRPVVVILPGIMGSHLRVNGMDRVWFDLSDLIAGGLSKIGWQQECVEAEDLWDRYYDSVCIFLSQSHRIKRFAYDWRQPLDVLGERLGEFLDGLLNETQQPVRLLAHSMGGLVIRACIHKRRAVMDTLMQRDGARLIMLGTPNQGAHSMVENLLGKGSTLRTLIRLDLHHGMQQVLNIVAGFRGALQLLPRPGFRDIFHGEPGGGEFFDYQRAQTWSTLNGKVRDVWFGDNKSAIPSQDALDAASWLWAQDDAASKVAGGGRPALPAAYEKKSVYVFGIARNTACGLREEGGRLKIVGTTRGDGTVTWESGRIGGIGSFYYMAAEHGDLPNTREYFPALAELLASGTTGALPTHPPTLRAIEQPQPVSYDAGPPTADDDEAIERSLMGGSLRNQVTPRPKRRLVVAVKAMDLRFLNQPIMVGHYEQDSIAGPEELIDRELLDGELSERRSLGLYAGPRGTVTVALRVPNEMERLRGSLTGAVVAGLGRYDGALSPTNLTDAVRTSVLRYLLQIIDVMGKADRELPLATLLLGYNSSANLSVGASVEALVRGVMEANTRFQEATRLNIRVSRLDIVEIYLDTAITAVYELRKLAVALGTQAEQQGTLLMCRNELEQGEGVRQRLFDNRDQGYWPRMMITDARCNRRTPLLSSDTDDKMVSNDGSARTMVADTLRFLYVGQRARAESIVQQRQPGLIETLVRQQIHNPVWQENFGRMLFQLMVPHDFKDAARQLKRVVLVVDGSTANLPWELMLADDLGRNDDELQPLAVRTPVVRQFSTSRFRRQVRHGFERSALVIGDPSTTGFGLAFSNTKTENAKDPVPLPGAAAEAKAVAEVLGSLGYRVREAIGSTCNATDVLSELYRESYRILHISAHGIFNLGHADGHARSGVVLSDGLLITAAEIEAMEIVPELVFLNCCHLGQIDATVRDGNKLAASVARELIEIGVRCVIVSGWAVNDEYAKLFGLEFYEELLLRSVSFGDAVFEARKRVWLADPTDITWGAFQAYGDPGWLAEPRADDAGNALATALFASPAELLDELARTRAELSRKRDRQNERETNEQLVRIKKILDTRCPAGWIALPALQSALGATWRDLGRFEEARAAFLAAIQAEDKSGHVPIRDIEQLAGVEIRLAEKYAELEIAAIAQGETAIAEAHPCGESAELLIDLALSRLDGLDALVSATTDHDAQPLFVFNAERSALRGSAYKRKASLYARRLLAAQSQPAELRQTPAAIAEKTKNAEAMAQALLKSVAAYWSGEGTPGDSRFAPYSVLNRLALDALTPWEDPAQRDAAIALAEHCHQTAVQAYARCPNPWDAMLQPETLLVEHLLDQSLGLAGAAGQEAFDKLAGAYRDAMLNISLKPIQLDSILSQMELLAIFFDALSLVTGQTSSGRTAQRLLDLVQQVQPGRPCRRDHPSPGWSRTAQAAQEAVKSRPRKRAVARKK